MRVIKDLILVILLCAICSSIVSADTHTIQKATQWRYQAYNYTGNYDIGYTLSDVYGGEPIGWCAFSQAGDVACEFRTVANYDVRSSELPFDRSQVVSATLNFTTTSWQVVRNAVMVDQIISQMVTPWGQDMYGQTIKTIAANKPANGTYNIDITDSFKMAMDSATESQGIAFRWYNDNDADPTSPWNGTAVVVETGFEVANNPTITVVYDPEPLDTMTINKAMQYRYHAYNDAIGVTLSDVYGGEPVGWCAFEQIDTTACEFRTIVNYDVRPDVLGFGPQDVVSATLYFTITPWLNGRNAVTVDQTVSNLVNPWVTDMYGQTITSNVFNNGWVDGTYNVNITDLFKEAMNYATENQGIAFRWYNDNDADPTAPWDSVNRIVVLNTGFHVVNSPTIVVGYNSRRCGDTGTYFFPEDINHDCKVSFKDFALMVANWIDLAD